MKREVEWRDIDTAQQRQQRDLPELYGRVRDSGGEVVWLVDGADAERRLCDCRAQHRIEYKQQATLGEMLTISTFLADVKRRAMPHGITGSHAAKVGFGCSGAIAVGVVNLQTNSIMRLPTTMLEDFSAHITAK